LCRKNEEKIGKEKNLSGGYQNCEKLFPLSFWEDGVSKVDDESAPVPLKDFHIAECYSSF
jgi:hypothetical protein